MGAYRIVSKVGDQVVVESETDDAKVIRRKAYTSRGILGPVVDVIGRRGKPYIIVKPLGNAQFNVGEEVHIK